MRPVGVRPAAEPPGPHRQSPPGCKDSKLRPRSVGRAVEKKDEKKSKDQLADLPLDPFALILPKFIDSD